MPKTVKINEKFICQHCSTENPPHPSSCRNHCRECLYSKHVDDEKPGDRKSECHSLMKPISAKSDKKRDMLIYHQCLKCSKQMANKAAPDDNQDLIIELSVVPYEPARN